MPTPTSCMVSLQTFIKALNHWNFSTFNFAYNTWRIKANLTKCAVFYPPSLRFCIFRKGKCNFCTFLRHSLKKILSSLLQHMNYMFFSPVFICMSLWKQAIKRYFKISRNLAVARERKKSCKEKIKA